MVVVNTDIASSSALVNIHFSSSAGTGIYNNKTEKKCFRKWAIDFGKHEELLRFSGAELLLDEISVKPK